VGDTREHAERTQLGNYMNFAVQTEFAVGGTIKQKSAERAVRELRPAQVTLVVAHRTAEYGRNV